MDAWEEGKRQHLLLSEAVADIYDDVYERSNFATGAYMRYEASTVQRAAQRALDRTIALDLGCGTGRDSFPLARYFTQVYAYDMSPAMIRAANRTKLRRGFGNIAFTVLDVESGPLPHPEASISLVNSAFGMGSFVRQPEVLFREVRRILMPGGVAVFSFYNSRALVDQIPISWAPALAARISPDEDALLVSVGEHQWRVAAHAYTYDTIRAKLEGNFPDNVELTTYPSLSALLPQTLFTADAARQLCTKVDDFLASNAEIHGGPYIVAICQKPGIPRQDSTRRGYERVLELLRTHNIHVTLRDHGPVRTMADVMKELDADPAAMVKSILIRVNPTPSPRPEEPHGQLYLAAVPANRKLDLAKMAAVLHTSRQRLTMATQADVEDMTGFQVGSVPPFGLPWNVPVVLDVRFGEHTEVWCGTGRSTESLRITLNDLRRVSACSEADISKPVE